MMYDSYGFPRYVSVAERRAQAKKTIEKLKKKHADLSPVVIEGTQIARSVWGKAWCKHLETFSDYSNRIPRGRSYVRSGSVIDLHIEKGLITAMVKGSSSKPYKVRMEVDCLSGARKEKIEALFREVQSLELLDLLQGKLPAALMTALTDPRDGLFPRVKEVKRSCSCPDFADFCKHQAAVLFGVGNRLDLQPELLFTLRGLDSTALTSQADAVLSQASVSELGDMDLGALFGVELVDSALWEEPEPQVSKEKAKAGRTRAPKEPGVTGKSDKKSPRSPKTPLDKLRYIQKYTQWDTAALSKKLSTAESRVIKWLAGQVTPSAPLAARIDALYKEVREIVKKTRSRS